jgi:1-acyl-sn-glycerol-3-phosphate acyltransferase
VPVIGLAWWALDFPFMKRHSRAALRKNPELRQQDRETTRKACAKFALVPTSVMNFAEGTRFTRPSTRPSPRPTATCSSPRPARWPWR